MFPGGSVGILIFFVISGYFLIDRKNISIKKIALEIQFYGIVLAIIGFVAYILKIPTAEEHYFGYIVKGITIPVTANMWWFGTSYILLVLLSPYLNKLLDRCNNKGAVALIALIYIVAQLNNAIGTDYYMLVFPIFYYFAGAYIKRFTNITQSRVGIKFVASGLLWLINSASWYIRFSTENMQLPLSTELLKKIISIVQYAILVPVCGISIFVLFLSLRDFHSKKINTIASCTFGVYLLHDSGITRQLIWNNIVKSGEQFLNDRFLLFAIISIASVYFICTVFELIRKKTIEPVQYKLWDKFKRKVVR